MNHFCPTATFVCFFVLMRSHILKNAYQRRAVHFASARIQRKLPSNKAEPFGEKGFATVRSFAAIMAVVLKAFRVMSCHHINKTHGYCEILFFSTSTELFECFHLV